MSGIVGTNAGRSSGKVGASAIGADAITGDEIADDAVDSEHYTDGSIDNAHIADDAIDSEHYAAGSIDNAHLADDAVGVAELSATGTASSSTFLRGDNSWAAAGGGKVLQAVTVVKTDATTSTSTSFVTISGMSVAITPSATSSKILVICNFNANQAVGANNPAYRIVRDSTAVNVGDASGSRNRSGAKANSYNTNVQVTASIMFLDAPSSTSSLTYALQWTTQRSTMYFNRSETFVDSSDYDSMASNITLIEIGA